MKKLLVLLMLVVSVVSFGAKVAGVEIQEGIDVGGKELVLNGAGIRKKAFLNLYVGSLYTVEKTTDETAVVTGEEEMSVRLEITSRMISNSAMKEAVEEGFDASTTDAEYAAISDRVEAFVEVFEEEISRGDQFAFDYIPGEGIRAYKNGNHLITVEGEDFKKALYGIWLGDNPADENLKKEMMNK